MQRDDALALTPAQPVHVIDSDTKSLRRGKVVGVQPTIWRQEELHYDAQLVIVSIRFGNDVEHFASGLVHNGWKG